MATVADIIELKGTTAHCVGPHDTVYTAIEKMVKHNIGALVVVENDSLVGVITERDYLRRIAVEGRTSKTTPVAAIMTVRPMTVAPDTTLQQCMHIMTERRLRHLPVISDGRLAGIVSIGDVVKSMITEQADHIEHLTEYIQGVRVYLT